MISIQNYKQKRKGFDLSKLDKETLETFKAVDDDFDSYMMFYSDEIDFKDIIDEHINLVNELFKEQKEQPASKIKEIAKKSPNVMILSNKPAKSKPKTKTKTGFNKMYDNLLKVFPDLEKTNRDIDQIYNSQKLPAYDKFTVESYIYDEDTQMRILDISQTYVQEGDLMSAPRMQIRVNFKEKTVEALNYESHNTFPQVYREVYNDGKVDLKEKNSQNSFLDQWLKNLHNQGFKLNLITGGELAEENEDKFKVGEIVQLVDLPKQVRYSEEMHDNPFYNAYGVVKHYQKDDVRVEIEDGRADGFMEVNLKKTNLTELPKKAAPKKVASKKPAVKKAKIEKVVNAKEISHFSSEYTLIRRFFNAIKKNEVLSFRQVELMHMAFNKSALDRKVRKTSKDAALFSTVHDKLIKMFKAADENKSDIKVMIKDQKLIEDLHEYVGAEKINYAITLLKSFVGMQGKKVAKDKAKRLLKRFDSALEKERVDCKNRLYTEFLSARKELAAYVEDSSSVIPVTKMGLSVTKKKSLNPTKYLDEDEKLKYEVESVLESDILEYHISTEDLPQKKEAQTISFDPGNTKQVPAENQPITENKNSEIEFISETNLPAVPFEDEAELKADEIAAPLLEDTMMPSDDFEVIENDQPAKGRLNRAAIEMPSNTNAKGLVKSMSDDTGEPAEFYNIKGELANFLGDIEIKPKESVAITLDAPQGAGKTRLLFQAQNTFASANYKCLFASLEEHPDSALFKQKRDQYITEENKSMIDTIGELPDNYQTLKELIPFYDVVFIDSWGKLAELVKQLDFDRDLRKAFDGKLFFVIFQRTQDGKMRGGSKSAFDGDIIMRIEKDDDFRKSYAYYDKHRYSKVPLNNLKFNFYEKKMLSNTTNTNQKHILL